MGRIPEDALVWAEIDLKAIAHNVRELRRITNPSARLMAVVKANGYGHGALEVAKEALNSGAKFLGVARIGEAIPLRKGGISAPILIFGTTPASGMGALIELDLTQTVFSFESARALSQAAAQSGKRIRVHVKVDTGMGRLGVLSRVGRADAAPGENAQGAVHEIESIVRLPGLDVEGLYTHFAGADLKDKSYAKEQLERFLSLGEQLRRNGIEFRVRHAANSAALIDIPESHMDMVRPGISIYGLYPSEEVNRDRVDLKPAMALKARIVQLKDVPAGFKVSYGMTHETPGPTGIATIAIGYADGLRRALSSRGRMLAGGRIVPIVGRVCMDLTMLDVGGASGLHAGDEVVLFGRQGESFISVDEVASELGTIHYEVVTTISERVPRVYLT